MRRSPMRYTLACSLLLCLFPSLCSADNIDHLRLRWRQMLTGGVHLDTSLPQVRARLASIESTGRHNWSSLQKSADRQTLWTDLSSTNVSADLSDTYFRLRDMAIAWATPGQALYQDPVLLLDTISGMEWMDSHRYNSRASEYDNWYDWEIGAPGAVVEIVILLHDELRADQLSRYTAGVNRFDSDCRVMIVNTVSTGANLADKCRIAILNGVLARDSARIAFAVNALSPLFTYVTSGD